MRGVESDSVPPTYFVSVCCWPSHSTQLLMKGLGEAADLPRLMLPYRQLEIKVFYFFYFFGVRVLLLSLELLSLY